MSDSSSIQYRGVVHGDVIKLDQPLNVPDGQAVVVTVAVSNSEAQTEPELIAQLPPGLREACGSWSDDEGLDEYLEYVRQNRKVGRSFKLDLD